MQEPRLPQKRVHLAKGNRLLAEGEEGITFVRPIDPADLVVLALSVVVAALRITQLIASKDHRRSLR